MHLTTDHLTNCTNIADMPGVSDENDPTLKPGNPKRFVAQPGDVEMSKGRCGSRAANSRPYAAPGPLTAPRPHPCHRPETGATPRHWPEAPLISVAIHRASQDEGGGAQSVD